MPRQRSQNDAVGENERAQEGRHPTSEARRRFLREGATLAGGAAMGATLGSSAVAVTGTENLPPNVPQWMQLTGPGVATHPYGMPSKFEKDVIRRTVSWLTASPISSISFTALSDLRGIITPNGLHFERYHAGIPEVNPEAHRLLIHGLVERPILLTMDDVVRFPSTSEIRFIECPNRVACCYPPLWR